MAPVTQPGREPLLLFRVLARDERLFARFFGAGLLDRGHLTLRQREIVIHRICALNRAEYEWGVHAAIFGERAGLGPQELAATIHGDAASPCWTADEALLIELCDESSRAAAVSPDLWRRLETRFGELAVLELLMLCGFYRTVSLLVNGLALPCESWGRRFAEFPPA
ncbi:hypothetical protein GCM10010994_34600 [Chelatococcus reniformis]|uniref:Carboxymuconolactone decarboxylase-like domain-containing protein n=1 Tax=Chelatococcus reniformis TaxID=1494448 RepID=A0A916XI33_9HYPH|nr:hypothetical protein GCM10010994_34600 [Chelatococcus reniformis]